MNDSRFFTIRWIEMKNLEPLPAIILALAEERSLSAVLQKIIEAVARQPGVALARLWLRESDSLCPVCLELGKQEALHLRASGGLWTRMDGAFHRIPLSPSNLKIAHMAASGESIRIEKLAKDEQWIRFPEWAKEHGLVSFAGHPLMFRGEVLGVLAVFRTIPTTDTCWAWLRTMADAASVAIANARAFEANEKLRRELELERDYLREEIRSTGAFGEIWAGVPRCSGCCIRWRWSVRRTPTSWYWARADRARN